ncbi:MAG: cytochrome c1 [Alphaproteobacteria bacterium]|nr:cytochrome c1 [Alphaproteobacteria bacterium]
MKIFLPALVSVFFLSVPAHASGGHTEAPPEMHWSFDGMTGTYDRGALQRGYQVYREVCSSCHSMDKIAFRNLADLGYTEEEIKAIASEYEVEDGPGEDGEMFMRTATPADYFPAPFPNKEAAMYANNGAAPPDMSLLAKARHGGANYIYGILTGYEDPPAEVHLMSGQHYNKYMAGNVLAMAPPLTDGQVSYADGSPETVMQYAKDVATFLSWASEPHMEARKQTGFKVLFFDLILAGLMYGVKRKIWADAH